MKDRIIEWVLAPGFYLTAVLILTRSRTRLLRLAAFMGLFGAIPGFALALFRIGWSVGFGHAGFVIRSAVVGAPFAAFGIPLVFGPYCFAVALGGGFLIEVAGVSPSPRVQTLAIIILPMLAAVPMGLLFEPFEAFGASSFWTLAMLYSRREIFSQEAAGSTASVYRWLTEFGAVSCQ